MMWNEMILRNQKEETRISVYAQVLLSVNKNENRYATTGTGKAVECLARNGTGDVIRGLIDVADPEQHDACCDEFANEGMFVRCRKAALCDQDRALWVCSPEQLLR